MVIQTKNNKYEHLNQDERVEIYTLLVQGNSIREIGRILQRSHSTISREIKRNSIDYGRGVYKYKPIQAEIFRTKRRKIANRKHIKLISNHSLRNKIYSLLSDKSKYRGPDEILGRLKVEGWKIVSTSTLYRYIFLYSNNRIRFLRFKHYRKRYSKDNRGCGLHHIPLIEVRPIEVNSRSSLNNRETDSIIGKDHKSGLNSTIERLSRLILLTKLKDLSKQTTFACLKYRLYNHNVLSLTSDNGGEFADNHNLGFPVYRAHPYSPFERGTNERHNGLVRWFIPKGTDINKYSNDDIKNIENILNHKPRKILHYKTPYEVYHNANLSYIN